MACDPAYFSALWRLKVGPRLPPDRGGQHSVPFRARPLVDPAEHRQQELVQAANGSWASDCTPVVSSTNIPTASARRLAAASSVDLPIPASHEQRGAMFGEPVDQRVEHLQLALAAEDRVLVGAVRDRTSAA